MRLLVERVDIIDRAQRYGAAATELDSIGASRSANRSLLMELRKIFPRATTHVLYCSQMYQRPKFLEVLLDIRREMAHEVDYDTDLFAEMIRTGRHTENSHSHSLSLPPEKRGDDRRKSESGKS